MSHLGRRLSALIDGELGDAERDLAHAHLVSCDACREEAAALRALKGRIRALGEAPADGDLTGRLLALGLGEPLTAARPRGHARYVVAGAVAALAVGLGAASFAAGGAGHVPGPTITPRVDVYDLQHAVMTGELPAPQPVPVSSAQTVPSLRP